ncbi:tRNA lysidine(34) synthetase TilS [Thermovirga lienii]|jgi:tRNA(Ile)-lysidine synthase|uniref:tRNA lysidine(34) synthetase TilS n=1 Tax=Thermovirga lienii TaxID=336261 RepID=UPI000EBD318B|nr:tRNA(Ile)-lysidine synthase [Thermovirga sp.]MDN5367890.1 tRNA(Ile)-lysidine synthase [Thermovirga sp.]HCD71138.1 tRNA lysidine(34) synthetase TilS [Thermovirga lienii]
MGIKVKDDNWYVKRVLEAGARQGWLEEPCGKMVVAVSGGSDSVALLWLLCQVWDKDKLVVAHVDHGIRKETSKRDALFVRNLAESWGLNIALLQVEVPKLCKKGESIEVAARRIRYDFFEKTAKSVGARWIALGHTANDQAETVLHNIIRGCGIKGLAGIPERRGKIVRPIIDFYRKELMELLRSKGIEWVSDETNEETIYTRNKIRLNLIPYIERNFNKQFVKHLLGISEIARPLANLVEEEAAKLDLWSSKNVPGMLKAWERSVILRRGLDRGLEVILLEGKRRNLKPLSRERISVLRELLNKRSFWRFQWERDIEIVGEKDLIVFRRREQAQKREFIEKEILVPGSNATGKLKWDDWSIEWKRAEKEERKVKLGVFSACVPFDNNYKIMSIGRFMTSSVEKCLKEKVKTEWRSMKERPVVTDEKRILWIPGTGGISLEASGKEQQLLVLKAHIKERRFLQDGQI